MTDLARALLEEIAADPAALARLRELVEAGAAPASPWMRADEAAQYLACKLSRVRKLTSTGDLPVHRDGTRVLYRREELDRFIRAGGALSP